MKAIFANPSGIFADKVSRHVAMKSKRYTLQPAFYPKQPAQTPKHRHHPD